jgi:hypothetical protein
VSAPNWFWPLSEEWGEYIAASGVEWCFPPGEPIEIRVIMEVEDDA